LTGTLCDSDFSASSDVSEKGAIVENLEKNPQIKNTLRILFCERGLNKFLPLEVPVNDIPQF